MCVCEVGGGGGDGETTLQRGFYLNFGSMFIANSMATAILSDMQ